MDTQVIPVLPVTPVPQPMDTPAALDIRPTGVRPVMKRRVNWGTPPTLLLQAMNTQAAQEAPVLWTMDIRAVPHTLPILALTLPRSNLPEHGVAPFSTVSM